MALKYGKKKTKLNSAFYTIVTVLLVSAVFLGMIEYLYVTAEEEAYENLHVQTKQIKDNIVLQLLSDRENLVTMANFAAKLHRDGEDYDLMFESFKSIGLIENIGILNPDNTFVTKAGSVDLDGLISFDEEKERTKTLVKSYSNLKTDELFIKCDLGEVVPTTQIEIIRSDYTIVLFELYTSGKDGHIITSDYKYILTIKSFLYYLCI